MICNQQYLAEVIGVAAVILTNCSTFQQTLHCMRTGSCAGIPWGMLKTRGLAITLFALSTFLYGGPVSMFWGNLFAFSNVVVMAIIKFNEGKRQRVQASEIVKTAVLAK